MGFETIFLIVVILLALFIALGTIIAVIVVLRRPETAAPKKQPLPSVSARIETAAKTKTPTPTPPSKPTYVPTPQEDIEAYLSEQREHLAEFELKDVSNTFKGTTNEGQRQGVILHLDDPEIPLIAFTSQAFNAQNGTVTAETIYGKMDLIIAQGKAGVKWDGKPLGVLEYSKQRIFGSEGQLLGGMEHPGPGKTGIDYYAISFVGQKAADVIMQINAISTLRWFGGEESEQLPAFKNILPDLEDKETLLLLAALLLEIGFFDLI